MHENIQELQKRSLQRQELPTAPAQIRASGITACAVSSPLSGQKNI